MPFCHSQLIFIYFINLFIFGGCVFTGVCAGFLQLQLAGASLPCGVRASHWSGFSCWGAQFLEHRLSSCGTWAYLFRGMWVLPGPGIEPVSPALAGRFLSTRLLGKSLNWFLLCAEPTLHCNKYIRVCVQDTIEGVVGPLQKQKIQSLCQVASISL